MNKATGSFTINIIGDTTGENYRGVFEVRTRISHRDNLREDEIRRTLLGTNPTTATPRAANTAEVFSQLHNRIVKAPTWWTGSDGGQDLEDDNVIAAIYENMIKARQESLDELKSQAEKAKEELAKLT